MRELDLLSQYLLQLRAERLQYAHQLALVREPSLLDIQVAAHDAELCSRINGAVKVLARDPGKFIQDFMKERE